MLGFLYSLIGHKNILKVFSYRFICNLCLLNLFSGELFTSIRTDPPGVTGISRGGPIWVIVFTPPRKSPAAGGCRQQSWWHCCPHCSGSLVGLLALSPSSPSLVRHTGGKRGRRQTEGRLASFGRTTEPKQRRTLFREESGRDIEKTLFHVFLYNLQLILSFPIGKAADCGL